MKKSLFFRQLFLMFLLVAFLGGCAMVVKEKDPPINEGYYLKWIRQMYQDLGDSNAQITELSAEIAELRAEIAESEGSNVQLDKAVFRLQLQFEQLQKKQKE